MIRLSIDTSFEHLSICISKNESPLVNFFSRNNRKNSKIIFAILDDLLKSAGINLIEVDLYIINCGPGSYTGVRLGMSVVKTFAQVFKKPIVPVNSLELIAGQIKNRKKDFHVLLNCTSREIFYANCKIVKNFPILNSPIYLSNLENFFKKSKNTSVALHRINPENRKPEPMFDILKKIPTDLPLPDALLLDSIGAWKFEKSLYDPKMPVNPLYIKREIYNTSKIS